ncbi:DUF2290 domain-containing protein [Naasia lichenicola]|uniref:DUF2290 domain-containing protein n=1 Tax=Naasia lichenicola TaxID=2565933 RepID=A0A4S4FSI8_9MICO|nr:DUF2290 domain-containing protein [Naasia lichenicola]THG33268.1 DUF2290 domain-containing protein [Naasia lichenicola]
MPAARTLKEQIENFSSFLVEEDLAVAVSPVLLHNDESQVSWHRRDPDRKFLETREHHSITNWKSWARNGVFTVMLFDGALLQIAFEVRDEVIVGHRLAYVPCPYQDADQVLMQLGLDDFIEYYEAVGLASARLETAVRFDYDPRAAKLGHPASHLTLNSSDVRIACVGPVSLAQFVRFVFGHFYPGLQRVRDYFETLPKPGHFSPSITSLEASEMHLAWDIG